MILPRYSIRTVLYLVVLVAVVALVAGQGVAGAEWAIAFTIAVGSLVIFWMMYVLFYGIISLFALIALKQDLQQSEGAHYPAFRNLQQRAETGEKPQEEA